MRDLVSWLLVAEALIVMVMVANRAKIRSLAPVPVKWRSGRSIGSGSRGCSEGK